MDLEEMEWQVVDRNHVTWNRDQRLAPVNIIINLKVPKKGWECLE
jgi:hypothetical protein